MKKLFALLAVFAMIAVLTVPIARAAETIKIGAAFALSGSIAVYGEGFKKSSIWPSRRSMPRAA